MATDIADWTSSVVVQSGVVSISGIATVSISGTPTVVISGTPSVNIANTPAVTISSGSVTIANASIGVINASGTKITSARPPVVLGTLQATPNTTNTGNFTLPADIQGLIIQLVDPLANYVHIKVAYHDLVGTIRYVPLEIYTFSQFVYVVPILPVATDSNLNPFGTIDVTLQSAVGQYADLGVVALFDAAPLWMQVYPLPQLEPNQLPVPLIVNVTLAQINTWLPVIAAVANVEICLFGILLQALQGIAGGVGTLVDIDFGFGATAITVTEFETLLISDSVGTYGAGPGALTFNGAPLGRGNGLWMRSNNGSALFTTYGHLVYSLR